MNKKYSYRCQLQLQNKGQNNSHNCDYSLDLMDQTTSNKLFWNRQNKTVSSEFLLNLYCNLMVIIKYKSLLNETIEKWCLKHHISYLSTNETKVITLYSKKMETKHKMPWSVHSQKKNLISPWAEIFTFSYIYKTNTQLKTYLYTDWVERMRKKRNIKWWDVYFWIKPKLRFLAKCKPQWLWLPNK